VAFLYLIRHPRTQPDPAVPASQWQLSDEGRAQVNALVGARFWQGVSAVYTSYQYKTTVVGEAVRAAHNIPYTPIEGLDEARRDEWVPAEGFRAAQAAFFSRVYTAPLPGWESAYAAQTRFSAAMDHVLSRHSMSDTLAVVSHASVLTLYVAYLLHEMPSYEAWSTLGFADIMTLDRASLRPITGFLEAPYAGLPYTVNRHL
jgi:broad specificity phosphatase PhoE